MAMTEPVTRRLPAVPVTLPTREQMADKLWSESCIEVAEAERQLAPIFERHQKALDACLEAKRENRYQMNELFLAAWREFQVKRQVAKELQK